jgi:hypothetical protein
MHISPNPFIDQWNISAKSPGEYEVILYDLNSKQIIQSKFTNTISLNVEKIKSGLYFYEIKDRNIIISKGKVMKL